MGDSAATELGRRGGLKGGKARAEKLSPKRRSEIAREAARRRWSKPEQQQSEASGSWLEKARGAMELMEYHDKFCPQLDLRTWFKDVVAVYEGRK